MRRRTILYYFSKFSQFEHYRPRHAVVKYYRTNDKTKRFTKGTVFLGIYEKEICINTCVCTGVMLYEQL